MRYSITTLLKLTLLLAIVIALSRFDSLLIPLAFPFTFGPIAAYRVTPTRSAILIGVLSSAFWSLVSVVPFGFLFYLVFEFVSALDEQSLPSGFFGLISISYFLPASILGGYIGGVVAREE